MREVGKPIAGKTGTTNDEKDVWFIGFTPDLAVGVYIGYDKPRHIGRGATGGHMAAPIVKDFFKMALADKPARAVPRAARHQADPHRSEDRHARRARPDRRDLEAFKPGTAPPESAPVIGFGGPDDQQQPQPYRVSPDADRAVRSGGTGGLYDGAAVPVAADALKGCCRHFDLIGCRSTGARARRRLGRAGLHVCNRLIAAAVLMGGGTHDARPGRARQPGMGQAGRTAGGRLAAVLRAE